MKKKDLKTLKLNKESVSNLEAEKVKGGADHTCHCPSFSICPPGVHCF